MEPLVLEERKERLFESGDTYLIPLLRKPDSGDTSINSAISLGEIGRCPRNPQEAAAANRLNETRTRTSETQESARGTRVVFQVRLLGNFQEIREGGNVRGTKVSIKEDLLIQLHQLGKAEDKSLSVLVDEILRTGLKSRSATPALCPKE